VLPSSVTVTTTRNAFGTRPLNAPWQVTRFPEAFAEMVPSLRSPVVNEHEACAPVTGRLNCAVTSTLRPRRLQDVVRASSTRLAAWFGALGAPVAGAGIVNSGGAAGPPEAAGGPAVGAGSDGAVGDGALVGADGALGALGAGAGVVPAVGALSGVLVSNVHQPDVLGAASPVPT
jgi:hypothetical protein